MKALFIAIAFMFSSAATAEMARIEVEVPEGAEVVVFTAKDVKVDTCNEVSLSVSNGFGAMNGEYYLYLTGTEWPCSTLAFRKVDLSTEASLTSGFGQLETIKVIYSTNIIENLQVDFK